MNEIQNDIFILDSAAHLDPVLLPDLINLLLVDVHLLPHGAHLIIKRAKSRLNLNC